MNQWRGKVVVVTGASSGIGAAICRKLVEEGCVVVGLARRLELMQQLAESVEGKPGKIHALKTDMTVEEEIKAAFEWISSNVGPVHVLVNNAGVMNCTNLVMGETSKWRQVLETNVLGLCIATREAIQIMKKNNVEGHIVNINSVAGHKQVYLPMTNLYSASKHAITNLTEMFRLEMIAENIRVKITSLSPGLVETDLLHHDHLADIIKSFPMLKSEDVANALIYILSTPPNVQVSELTIKPYGEMQ
ncbi:PREDICTED: farnesol dehydrogenase-like [Nicrophorus vespilloides]|uniref:Farnesol dehydrogenase-like n=1 Tax=Nicrophorus vespilloides TaxID=110193 RepID=A0ABM1MS63_NICVS|nr:PREDICTED: farnesol dehydrogenase-like [Nicrophorus vespilloides]